MAPKSAKVTPIRPAPQQQIRADGWINVLTGLGDISRDKRLAASFQADRIDWWALEELWRGDDMAGRIVELIPEEMTREGYHLTFESDDGGHDLAQALESKAEALGADEHFQQALNYERAYGGAGILVGANDGQKDLAKPLIPERVRSVDWLNTLSPRELYPVRWYTDPRQAKYGLPSVYRIVREMSQGAMQTGLDLIEVHESRLILFPGIRISRRQLRENRSWGDSVLVRCNQVISDFQQSWQGVAHLLQDFAQGVFKMKDLAEAIATNNDNLVIKRAQVMDMTRSVARGILIDKEEDFMRQGTPVSGLPELIDRVCNRLSAACGIPVTLLMGQAPAGLNATGDSDIRFFYDKIAAAQKKVLAPRLKTLYRLLMMVPGSPTKGTDPGNWSIAFNPLWQLSDPEREKMRLDVATRDAAYIAAGVVTPEEVATSRFGGDEYSAETVVDFDAREKLAAENPDPNDPTGGTGAAGEGGNPGSVPDDTQGTGPTSPDGTPSNGLNVTVKVQAKGIPKNQQSS